MCIEGGGGVQADMHTCVLHRNETGLYHFLTKKKKKRNLRGKEKDHFNLKAILSQYWNKAYNNIPNSNVHGDKGKTTYKYKNKKARQISVPVNLSST